MSERVPPRAVPALTLALALIFALEVLCGSGAVTVPVLVRMGAVAPDQGDAPLRWLAHGALHGSFLHAGMNLYVLYMVGGSMEVVLGPWRVLLIFVASVVGGGVAMQLATPEAVGIGSSGGIWGLFGAFAWLVYHPQGILAEEGAARLREGVVRMLVLNLMISLVPGISAAAHLGGGLVGTLLMATGLLAWRPDRPVRWPIPTPAWLKGAGAAATLIYAGATAVSIGRGAPWELAAASEWVRVPAFAGSVEVPSILTDLGMEEGDRLFGDTWRDPAMVQVQVRDVPLADEEVRAVVDLFLESWKEDGGRAEARREGSLWVIDGRQGEQAAHLRIGPAGWVSVMVIADPDSGLDVLTWARRVAGSYVAGGETVPTRDRRPVPMEESR